jgi:hypothetical protein
VASFRKVARRGDIVSAAPSRRTYILGSAHAETASGTEREINPGAHSPSHSVRATVIDAD